MSHGNFISLGIWGAYPDVFRAYSLPGAQGSDKALGINMCMGESNKYRLAVFEKSAVSTILSLWL